MPKQCAGLSLVICQAALQYAPLPTQGSHNRLQTLRHSVSLEVQYDATFINADKKDKATGGCWALGSSCLQ